MLYLKHPSWDVLKWRNKDDIATYIKPLKCEGDKAMPTRRAEIELRYLQWRARHRNNIIADEIVATNLEMWKNEYDMKNRGNESS